MNAIKEHSHPSRMSIRSSSKISEDRTKSPKGRIRIQTCTYKDNRCLGIDFRMDRSAECIID